jgi:hypothetical protein
MFGFSTGPYYESYLLLAAVAWWAGSKAWRFMEHRRWRWTIADWLVATFWISVALALAFAGR